MRGNAMNKENEAKGISNLSPLVTIFVFLVFQLILLGFIRINLENLGNLLDAIYLLPLASIAGLVVAAKILGKVNFSQPKEKKQEVKSFGFGARFSTPAENQVNETKEIAIVKKNSWSW